MQAALQKERVVNARFRLQRLKSWQTHLDCQSLPPKRQAKKYLFAYPVLQKWKPKRGEGESKKDNKLSILNLWCLWKINMLSLHLAK